MQAPFYTQWTAFFQPTNTTAFTDIVRQFDLVERYTRNSTTGLLKHGYDESKAAVWADDITGACPEVWDRALGWYLMALLDVLDYFPSSQAGSATLKKYFTRVVAAVKRAADPTTGGWWLVMSEPWPGHTGNYIETSGTAMFVYAMLKGIRKGYINKADYFPTAEKAYKLLLAQYVVEDSNGLLNWEGTVRVGSLGSNGTFEVFSSNPRVSKFWRWSNTDLRFLVLHFSGKTAERPQGSWAFHLCQHRVRSDEKYLIVML